MLERKQEVKLPLAKRNVHYVPLLAFKDTSFTTGLLSFFQGANKQVEA